MKTEVASNAFLYPKLTISFLGCYSVENALKSLDYLQKVFDSRLHIQSTFGSLWIVLKCETNFAALSLWEGIVLEVYIFGILIIIWQK